MNILITGVAGGIGSTLSLHLKWMGYYVVGLDNFYIGHDKNLYEDGKCVCDDFYYFDLAKDSSDLLADILKHNNIDVVVHLAAITTLADAESNPSRTITTNVSGTINVIEAIRKYKNIKLILASTAAVYENNTEYEFPFTEDLEVSPTLMYPLSKKMMEDVATSYYYNYDMDITIFRFFNIFGPRQDMWRTSPPLLNYIAREWKMGRQPVFYSNGISRRDYIFVDDIVDLIEQSFHKDCSNEIFNVCSERNFSLLDILECAKEAFPGFKYAQNPPTEYWNAYPTLFTGENPLSKGIVRREVDKSTLGSNSKTKRWFTEWNPNTNIEGLIVVTLQECYDRYEV